jgi:DinB superfamily
MVPDEVETKTYWISDLLRQAVAAMRAPTSLRVAAGDPLDPEPGKGRPMTSAERFELIDRYKQGYAEVTRALAGIAPEELDWKPAKSEWSAREVVHHLADSEMIAAVRLRRMLIADDAQLWRYDPDELAVRFTYAKRPLEAAMALFQGVRAYTAELLDRMTEADWAKAGMPTPTGEYSTARWLQSYGPHAHEHAEQIRNNRDSFRRK